MTMRHAHAMLMPIGSGQDTGPERMKNVSGTHRNVIETSSGDGKGGRQAGRSMGHGTLDI